MRLFSVIVPPPAVVDEVCAVVVGVPAGSEQQPPRPRGLWGRIGGRAAAPAPPEPPAQLTVPGPGHVLLPLTGFGNVTLGDSVRLRAALRQEAARWRRPTVRFAGATALEWPGDQSVWAKLDGDIEALLAIGRAVPHIVQRLGFFVDRRQFRPWVSVGTINDTTTAPYLQSVVDALEAFRGQPWTIDSISLMRGLPEEDADAFTELERIPLGRS